MTATRRIFLTGATFLALFSAVPGGAIAQTQTTYPAAACGFPATTTARISDRGGVSAARFINSAAPNTLIQIDEDVTIDRPLKPADGVTLAGNGAALNGSGVRKVLISSSSRFGVSGLTLIGGRVVVAQKGGELLMCGVTIQGAKRHGLLISGQASFSLSDFRAVGNGLSGLALRGRATGQVNGAEFSENGGSGVTENSSAPVSFTNVQANRNARHGMSVLQKSKRTTVRDGVFNDNGRNGVVMGRSVPDMRDAAADWSFTNIVADRNGRNGFSVDVVIGGDPIVFPMRGTVSGLKTRGNEVNGVNLNYATGMVISNVETTNNLKNGLIGISLDNATINGLVSANNGGIGVSLTAARSAPVPDGDRVRVTNTSIYGNRRRDVRVHPSYRDTGL